MEAVNNTDTKEKIPLADQIVIVTNFLYKNYHSPVEGRKRDIEDTDGIRGDLAIQSLKKAIDLGVNVVAADGGSSKEFLSTLEKFKNTGLLIIESTDKPGRGPQRRAAFEKAIQLSGKSAIVYFQPEKVSLIDHLAEITQPILDDTADIVLPARTAELFEQSYPNYMRKSELNVNKTYDWLMHKNGLLPENEKLDWFFGPVVFKNDPEIASYFLKQYRLKSPIKSRIGAKPNPEMHSDGHYFPIIEALFNKKRVVSVTVPFVYPETQRDNETSSQKIAQFQQRRREDASAYRLEALHFIEYLTGNTESKILAGDEK